MHSSRIFFRSSPPAKAGPVIAWCGSCPNLISFVSSFETRKCTLVGIRNYVTGVKNGSGAPSVVLNTTFTFCPIFNLAMSQSTKLVSNDGPSFKVT